MALKPMDCLCFFVKVLKNDQFLKKKTQWSTPDLSPQPAIVVLPVLPAIASPSGRDLTTHPRKKGGDHLSLSVADRIKAYENGKGVDHIPIREVINCT